MQLIVGMTVKATYRSGEYVGQLVDVQADRTKVQILAVIKHPDQGNLHRPQDPDVRIFHERRALAHKEIALVPREDISVYDGDIPNYEASLKDALHAKIAEIEKTARWAKACLERLHSLREDYHI